MTRSIAFAAALAFAAVAVAHAEDRTTAHLNVSGYDLSKPADAKIVYAKLNQAAHRVCANAGHEVFGSEEAERLDQCVRFALDNVVAQSKSPLLAALNGQAAPKADKARLAAR